MMVRRLPRQPQWLTRSSAWKGTGVIRWQPQQYAVPVQKRFKATEAGDDNSGHIATKQNEGVLFFTNVSGGITLHGFGLFRIFWPLEILFPNTLEKNRGRMISTLNEKIFNDAIKNSSIGDVSLVESLPRWREGSSFLKFSHDAAIDSGKVSSAVVSHLEAHRISPWWEPFGRVRASLVRGKPWVEDLYRIPARRLRVEFMPTSPGGETAELTQEQLYSFFRPYGKLADIIPQPSDSKVLPRYAHLDFQSIQTAVMAKNCLHGYTVTPEEGGGKLGTVFRLTYERKQKAGWIKDWIFGHPRIVIPLLAALVAGITVAVFDPIRTMSIKAHITRAFHVRDYPIIGWILRRSQDVIDQLRSYGGKAYASGMQAVWEDRKDEIGKIQTWLMETVDTFIVVQGPRGSGKRELVVDHALRDKRRAGRVLIIDCKPIQEARGDSATINAAAAQVGYRPVFSWMNSISGLVDLAAQGATGVKTGFSETLENQLSKIWNNTASALKGIALDGKKHDEKDKNMSDDEYLEAHPERRPVVVIENFLHKSNEPGAALVYDKLAEWAARVTTSNFAHVVFLTTDVSFSKSLSKALPDRTFRQISLGDCTPEVAKRYVINHLDFSPDVAAQIESGDDATKKLTPSQQREDLKELDSVLSLLGGRLTDLEFLARRIKSGETPSNAVDEIISQSASEVLKMFLLPGASNGEERGFTPQQAWTLVRSLAKADTLRFNELLLADAFKSNGEKAIAALEQAELISVQSSNGRPTSIKPGRPVYLPAFRRLVEDRVLAAKMDLVLLGTAVSGENASISKMEEELELLGKLPKQPGELASRIQWLLTKIAGSQTKIEGWEKEQGELKKVLQTEF